MADNTVRTIDERLTAVEIKVELLQRQLDDLTAALREAFPDAAKKKE